MSSLHETQRRFTNYALRNLGQAHAAEGIRENGLDALHRLAIYRNNTQLGLTEALRDGYPVVSKLVGHEFFNHLTRNFIQRYPPKAGCLLFFGKEFADFVEEFQPAEALPYLPDTARLEWCWHEAFHEAGATAFDIARLVQVDPEHYGSLGFTLHPSARFLVSDYPVLRIWQSNQEGYEGDCQINLDDDGCRLLIFRPGLEVEIVPLNSIEYEFLYLLAMKLTLAQAVELAVSKEPKFDVQAVLQYWVRAGLFTDFYLKY